METGTRINLGSEAMEPALTPGGSTPLHDHKPGESPLHRIHYDGALQLQDGGHEGNAQPRPYEEADFHYTRVWWFQHTVAFEGQLELGSSVASLKRKRAWLVWAWK
ncbi:UNVERIFIED_CONTAM: hypothetical protein FKN15_022509 [Acipenser sinensis]